MSRARDEGGGGLLSDGRSWSEVTVAYAAGLEALGYRITKRHGERSLHVRAPSGKHDARMEFDTATLRQQALELFDDGVLGEVEAEPRWLAGTLGVILGDELPDAVSMARSAVRGLLRPRLVGREAFVGQARTAVRREAFDGWYYALSVGPTDGAMLVRTEHLDAWGEPFERSFEAAVAAYAARLTGDHVHELEGEEALLVVVHPLERANCAHLLFPRIMPGYEGGRGVAFALPTDRACVCMPVTAEAGAAGLASLVRTAFALTPEDAPESRRRLYWSREAGVLPLEMTHIEDAEGARVQLEAVGPVAELLRALGEIE